MITESVNRARVTPANHRFMPWKNGLGSTCEIAIDPPGSGVASGGFRWRLSIATVDRSCPFSTFPGYDRTIMLVDGHGMILTVAGRSPRRMTELFEPFAFSGDDPADCALIDGPVDDFNLMVDRSRLRAETKILQLQRNSVRLEVSGPTVILHCLRGELGVHIPNGWHEGLAEGETLIVETKTREHRTGIEMSAGGETIAAWFELREVPSSR